MIQRLFVAAMLILALSIGQAQATDKETCKDKPKYAHELNYESGNTLSNLTFITKGKAYMTLYSGISVSDFTRMTSDIIKLRDHTDIREINLIINSPGGSAFDGLSIADLVNRAQNDWGFVITADASGIVASAAVPVFVVCKHRKAAPGTLFMVHEAALFKWPGKETMSDIISQGDLMKKLQDKYIGYLVDNSDVKKSEWLAMEKKTTWFTTDKACEFGIIDEGCKADMSVFENEGGN